MAIGEFGKAPGVAAGAFPLSAPMYWFYEMSQAAVIPSRAMADATRLLFRNPVNPWAHTTFGKSLAAGLRQVVLGEFAVAPRLDPAVMSQACGGGAHQPLIVTKRNGQPNQAAQCDRTPARHDGIAEDRDDERPGALRALPGPARE